LPLGQDQSEDMVAHRLQVSGNRKSVESEIMGLKRYHR
jgi:hypothetical protein